MRHLTKLNMGTHAWQRFGILLACCTAFFILVLKALPLSTSSINYSSTNSNYLSAIETDFVVVPLEEIMSGDPIELSQNDPRIKKYIWNHQYLLEPSTKPYNLSTPNIDPSMGQGQTIRRLFRNMEGGFFVESGALDGETRSNTLYLEKNLGWKGLLVEPDPSNYAMVLEKNRKAWTSNTCMATKPYPHKVVFQQQFNIGKISEGSTKQFRNYTKQGFIVAQCFPLYSLLSALSISTIDYFSLDVEGTEMELLENIPFDKIFIKTLSVEFNHIPKGKDALKNFMEDKGYIVVAEVKHPLSLANDFIFVHKSLHNLIAEAKKLSIMDRGNAPSKSNLRLSAPSRMSTLINDKQYMINN